MRACRPRGTARRAGVGERGHGMDLTWARANATSSSTISSTTSNSSRRNFAQGSSGRARIGDRSESLGIATTKLEKLAVRGSPPLSRRQWNGCANFVVGVIYQSEPFRD
jgi:hypothetical protein